MSEARRARVWCEIDCQALADNLRELGRANGNALLAPVVKANAYGHGLALAAGAFGDGGADWFCVDSLEEAAELRAAGRGEPVLVLGWVPPEQIPNAVRLDARLVLSDPAAARALSAAAVAAGREVAVHLKLETGNNRRGLLPPEAVRLAERVRRLPGLRFEGLSTHFADIEDTTDHGFARLQLARLRETVDTLRQSRLAPSVVHCANSAATILWPEAHLDLVRVGIAAYGMWPSRETYITALTTQRHRVALRPALTWKARIAQLKAVSPGETVGYGRSFQVTHPTLLAVLPVGYYDGYDRRLSNIAHVLVRGHRAPVRGRVCMNMIMADVTDVPGVTPDDEVVLLGRQGAETVTAELLADWIGTINYEVTTRIAAHVPRIPAPEAPRILRALRARASG